MAKKHPIYRLHKIQIHPNRWLIWALAYSLIVAIALMGYIAVTEVDFETQVSDTDFQPRHFYRDSRLGFSLHYPADWSVEAVDSSTISFVPTKNMDQGVTVEVTEPSLEKTIRKSLKISGERAIRLDSNPAVKIINDLGRGHFETVVLATHNNKLYVLRGTDTLVQQLSLTFHFK